MGYICASANKPNAMHTSFPLRAYSALFLLLALLLPGCQSGGDDAPRRAQAAEQAPSKPAKPEPLLSRADAAERLRQYAQEHPETQAVIHTPLGPIKVRLHAETPLHRANFVRLAKRGYYDETMFHRIVPGFVAQAGGTDERKKVKIGKYRVPAEIMPERHFHKRGALAMARYDDDNPNLESDSHEFYLVWGEDFTPASLSRLESRYGLSVQGARRQAYLSGGGSPHLDGRYTVFGEVESGLDVLEKLCRLEIDARGWPLQDMPIRVEILPAP
jgi:peptidyl-prolyl cis-trans isomerase B (cyclophilin B)